MDIECHFFKKSCGSQGHGVEVWVTRIPQVSGPEPNLPTILGMARASLCKEGGASTSPGSPS